MSGSERRPAARLPDAAAAAAAAAVAVRTAAVAVAAALAATAVGSAALLAALAATAVGPPLYGPLGLQRNDDVLLWRLLPSVRLPQIVRRHWLRRLPKRTSHLRFRHGLLLPDVLERHEVPLDGVR